MKGTIPNCIQSLACSRFGAAVWKETLANAGLPTTRSYPMLEEVPDSEPMDLLEGMVKATGIPMPEMMAVFGEYWSTIYAPSVYKSFFDSAKSTRELLLKLDEIHVAMARTLKNAKPPRFTYEWLSDKHLVMRYQSDRGLVALMPGLIAGLGKYYKDTPLTQVQGTAIHIFFT